MNEILEKMFSLWEQKKDEKTKKECCLSFVALSPSMFTGEHSIMNMPESSLEICFYGKSDFLIDCIKYYKEHCL